MIIVEFGNPQLPNFERWRAGPGSVRGRNYNYVVQRNSISDNIGFLPLNYWKNFTPIRNFGPRPFSFDGAAGLRSAGK